MTDISSSIATNSSHPTAAVFAPSAVSPTVNGSVSNAVVHDDNEDYTIKCICSYGDDDGSTVYCEKCDTWQHIICYYNGKKVPDIHFCAECDPRQLDAKRATECQKRLREHIDGGERKARRPPSKSHKKKKDSAATTEQTNGLHSHGRHESTSAGRDQPPPAKRPKTSHRPSTSIASTNGVPALPEPRKRASSNVSAYPSPIKSPLSQPLQPPIPTYTPEFLNLYEKDRGKDNIHDSRNPRLYSNSMSMAVTNDLTSWYDNPFALKQATGRQHQEVFHQSDQPIRPETWPRIILKEKKNTETSYEGRFPRWKCIILDTNVKKDDFIGEIRGDIGRLEDYCFDPDTRWSELRHPEPFVFFHPQIPIYIDSRAEGTHFRYVRRSCHPNVSLKTFVTGERDFHHCFVAKENISAGAELTAMWYVDQSLLNNGKVKEENGDEEEAKRPATYFSKILANFGDCACDSTDCWLKNFDLRTPPDHPKRRIEGRRSRGNAKNVASPNSTGPASNSRSNSENVQGTEEEDQAESRSTSGSIRSKPQSRDITPANPTQIDTAQDPALGMSARERRKILMAEKAFEDQESKKQRSKRKRTSGGPTISTPAGGSKNASTSASSLPPTPSAISRPSQLNTASNTNLIGSPPLSAPVRGTTNMSPRKSSVPNTPLSLSQLTRPKYVDRGMQTDPEPKEPEEPEPTGPVPGWEKCFETPYMRRMRRYMEYERKDRIKKEELKRKIDAGLVSQFAEIVPTWVEERDEKDKLRAERRAKEAKQTEEPAAVVISPPQDILNAADSAEEFKTVTPASVVQLPPPPLPSQAAHTQNKVRPPYSQKLQLSTLPPVPTFNTSTTTGAQAPSAFSPTPTTPSVPQSPFGYVASSQSYPGLSSGAVAPSPVKKKLSLGDYMSLRSNLATPTVEKTQVQAAATAAADSASHTVQATINTQQVLSNAPVSESHSFTIMGRSDNLVKAEAEAAGVMESTAVTDPPSTADSDAAAPAAMTTAPVISSAGPKISPELSSVLSNLQALAGSAAQRGSSGS